MRFSSCPRGQRLGESYFGLIFMGKDANHHESIGILKTSNLILKEVKMSEKRVMVIGIGRVGNFALEFLVRTKEIDSLFVADSDNEMGLSRTRAAIYGAAHMGYYPTVEFVHLDLNNIEETASILNKIAPDVILNFATFLSAVRLLTELPPDMLKKFKTVATFGIWLPSQLVLSYKLMQAVKKANIKTHVIVSGLPDVVCPVLGKVGLAPTVGLGNIDNFVPELKKLVAERLRIHMRDVSLCMIFHHVFGDLVKFGGIEKVPYYLKIFALNEDVTQKFNLTQLLIEAHSQIQTESRTAASGVKNVLALLNNTREVTHAPGPQGLPGGYPVRLGSEGAEVVLPRDVSMQQAIRINEEQQKHEAIERIEDDGAVVYTEPVVEFMKETLGYDCSRIELNENEEKAKELLSRFRELVAKCGKK